MASIIVVTGERHGDYYPLGRRSNIIGRDEGLPIQVLDPKVSRKHVKIGYDHQQEVYTVCDLKSTHGTLINGVPLNVESQLADDTYVTIGDTTLLFTMKDFNDRENALLHFKKVGQRTKPTFM
jgi:pSer/pThr/pTyr-binding forkhead associated (FHA) protein